MYWKQLIVRILETITFILETLLSLNADRIAGIAFSSFPGRCSLNKSTQEIFFTFIYLLKLCIVVYNMDVEPRTFLFTDFALRKKEKVICFKRGNCHFIVCSVSSVCIPIPTSNKYRSFSYWDIYHYFGFVRTTSTGRLAGVQFVYVSAWIQFFIILMFFSMKVVNIFLS